MAPSGGDKRSPIAFGLEMYSQIVSVAVMMVLPAGAGYWADSRLGTAPWLLVAGAALGLSGGMVQLLRGVGASKRKADDKNRGSDEKQR
jgi:F0F1-type ATP synthase assembly protein I